MKKDTKLVAQAESLLSVIEPGDNNGHTLAGAIHRYGMAVFLAKTNPTEWADAATTTERELRGLVARLKLARLRRIRRKRR